jgi:succinate dehydrogenase hydrophobic anchor subunit
MVEISPLTGGRARPRQDRRETRIWLLMRLTGLALFVFALAHFSILHFVFDPAEQDAEFIIEQRWSQLFWRTFDWLLLTAVLVHSFLGMRVVFQDHFRERALRAGLGILYVLAATLFVLGTWVVFTLPGLGGASG